MFGNILGGVERFLGVNQPAQKPQPVKTTAPAKSNPVKISAAPSFNAPGGAGFKAPINPPKTTNKPNASDAVSHFVGGLISPITNTIGLTANDVKLAAARATGNQQARANADKAGMKNVQGLENTAHAFTRVVPEAVTSLTGTQKTYTPGSPVEKFLFGKTPVQNVEKNVANNYDTHKNLNPAERIGLAGLDLTGQAAQVAPVVGAAGKLGKIGIEGTKAAQLEAASRGVSPEAGFAKIPSKAEVPKITTPKAAKPTPEPVAKPTTTVPVGPKPPGRGFTASVKNSREVSAETKAALPKSTYTPKTNADMVASSEKLTKGNMTAATNKVLSDLSQTTGRITPQQISDAISVAKAHDKAGNFDQASAIYDKLSSHGTAAGQKVQAFSLLSSRTPEGIKYKAMQDLKNGGANITSDVTKQVQDAYKAIAKTKEGTNERAFAVQDLQKIVNDNVKQSKLNQAFTLWRTGLLTGPLTASKVAISHALMNIAEKAKDVPAVTLDKVISPFTGVRSTSFTGRGLAKGAGEGAQAAKTLLRTGHETPGTSAWSGTFSELGHSGTSFGTSKAGKVANFYTQKVGQVHAAIPKPFYRSAYENDLYKQANAAASTAGIKGDAKEAFIQKFVTKPSEEADNQAHLAAQHATFQQPTFLGRQASAFQQIPGGRALAPFAHIASAILTDVKDYSPIGAMQAVYKAAKDSKGGWSPEIQKQLVEGVGRGVTGTGLIWLGTKLFQQGKITTGYPTDKTEQQIWKSQGKQENSILVDGKWRQTPSLGPFGSLLSAGALLESSKGTNAKGKSNATAALTGALSNISSQSYLSGLTQGASALQNPTASSKSFLKLEAGSLVPVGLAQTAAATDKSQRVTNTPLDAIKGKIPGLREKLPVATDAYGAPMKNPDTGLTGFLDPTKPTPAVNDPLVNEMQRLYTATGTAPVPEPATKISGTDANGAKVSIPLTKPQQAQFTKISGPQVRTAQTAVMQTPGYANLSDDSKNTALSNAKGDIEAVVKNQMLNGINGGSVKLTTMQRVIAQGGKPDYVAAAAAKDAGVTDTATASLDPKVKYQADLANFQAEQKAGTIDPVKAFTTQQSLNKEAITSNYPTTVTELYAMSKANITSYLNTVADPSSVENQLSQLDNQLLAAGIISTAKFKDGITTSGSSSGSSTAKTIKAPSSFGTTYTKLASLLKGSEKSLKVPGISTKANKIKPISIGKIPKSPKFPKPRSATSISKKTGNVKLNA